MTGCKIRAFVAFRGKNDVRKDSSPCGTSELKRFRLSRATERGHVPLVVLAGSRSSEIPLVVITMELAVELAAGAPGAAR